MKTKNNTATTKKSVKKITADNKTAGIEKKFKRIRTVCDSLITILMIQESICRKLQKL